MDSLGTSLIDYCFQAYRVCNDGRDGPHGAGFVCPNGTLFDQYQFACEFWHKVVFEFLYEIPKVKFL